MRLPSRLSVVLITVLAAMLAPFVVRAGGVMTEDLIPIANQFGMVCTPTADAQDCQTEVEDPNRWAATLRPASGLVTGTVTHVAQYYPAQPASRRRLRLPREGWPGPMRPHRPPSSTNC